MNGSVTYHINPTGKFVIGGPHGDSGVTGRKIIVDTYGGMGRHGGGAFSGKDPTKVDRSAAYMARYVAKNIVASGLAERCEIQLAYAIGVSEPVSVHVDTQGTGTLPDSLIADLVRSHFRLNPSGIIKHLDLRRPIYRKTASGGHFGRSEPEFTWEKTDKAHVLREAAMSCDTSTDCVMHVHIVASTFGPGAARPSRRVRRRAGCLGLCSGPRRAAGQPHRLQRRAGPGRGGRSLDGHRRPQGRGAGSECLLESIFDETDAILARRNRAIGGGIVGALCPRRLLGTWQTWYGPLTSGFEAVIAGDVPLGAGLSSSASLQASFALVLDSARLGPGRSVPLNSTADRGDLQRMELAQVLRRSENEFVGVGSGLLDQFSSLFGRAGHALFLDCSTLDYDRVPLGDLRAGDRGLRLANLAAAGRWDVRPQARGVRAGDRVFSR